MHLSNGWPGSQSSKCCQDEKDWYAKPIQLFDSCPQNAKPAYPSCSLHPSECCTSIDIHFVIRNSCPQLEKVANSYFDELNCPYSGWNHRSFCRFRCRHGWLRPRRFKCQNISEGQQKERVKPQRPPHESLHIQHFARSSESEGIRKQHTVSTNAAIQPLTSTPNRKWLITPDAC